MKTFMIKICLVIVIAGFSGLYSMQVTQATETKAQDITYRLAQPKDLEQILHIYKDNFDADDQHKLLVLPETMRAKAIETNIHKKRLFVATDRDGTIVSFVKVFVIDDQKELQEILHDELRFKAPKEGGKFLGQCAYDIPVKKIFDYKQEVKTAVIESRESVLPNYVFGVPDCMYMYYGNAYTCREYRRHKIATTLLSFAFDYVAKKLAEEAPLELDNLFIDEAAIEKVPPMRGVALVYGQVNANIGQMGQLRPFANFVCTMRSAPMKNINVHHVMFEAYKPKFVFDTEGHLSVQDIKENQGRGNMLYIALN